MSVMNSPAQVRVKQRFTLIELLVVIAIIAILAGILMPALSSARERGRSAVCINNLKSMSNALHSYQDDFRGIIIYQYVLPAGNPSWLSKLYDCKYLGFTKVMSSNGSSFGRFNRVTFCPAAAYDPPYQSYDKTEFRTYGMLTLDGDNDYTAATNSKKDVVGNIWFDQSLGGSYKIRYYKVANVKTPSAVVYFGETSYNKLASEVERNRPCWQFYVSKNYSGVPLLKLQHADRANVVAFDGHVASQDRYQLRLGPMCVKYVNDANGETFGL